MREKKHLSPEWIRELRGDLTQEAFAEALGGRINKGMVSKWENGDDEPMARATRALLAYAARRGEAKAKDVQSPSMADMSDTEVEFLKHFRKLPHKRRVELLTKVAVEADQYSQTPAAHTTKE